MPGSDLLGNEELNNLSDLFKKGSGVLYRYGNQDRRERFFVKEFEQSLSKYLGQDGYCLGVTSGTAALRVALAALGICEGDNVITSSFTFVATVEAIIESGATPRCAEIDQTLNICHKSVESLIDKNTKAIIAVHMLGHSANIAKLKDICNKYNLILIEDTAWGLGGSYAGQKLGTFSDISTFSFDYAKAITTGEGGMIWTRSKEIWEKCSAWHDHGHENNPSLARWEDSRSGSGFNFRMSELQGAVGLAQLQKLDYIIEQQVTNAKILMDLFSKNADLSFRETHANNSPTYDALVIRFSSITNALSFRKLMLDVGLGTKILPEAFTWHFAGTWTHMPELVESHSPAGTLSQVFQKSSDLLRRHAAIPVPLRLSEEMIESVKLVASRIGDQK